MGRKPKQPTTQETRERDTWRLSVIKNMSTTLTNLEQLHRRVSNVATLQATIAQGLSDLEDKVDNLDRRQMHQHEQLLTLQQAHAQGLGEREPWRLSVHKSILHLTKTMKKVLDAHDAIHLRLRTVETFQHTTEDRRRDLERGRADGKEAQKNGGSQEP